MLHDLILKKLRDKFKIYGLMLRFIKSYLLQDRQQEIIVGGVKSGVLPVKSGVPQGSIVVCYIYQRYVLNCISNDTSTAVYADNTKMWRGIDSSGDHFALQNDIDKLNEWSLANKMKFHPSKCKALSVSNQRNVLHILPFTKFIDKLSNVFIDQPNHRLI